MFMKPVASGSNLLQVSWNCRVVSAENTNYSSSEESAKPYKIIAMNRFKKTKETTSTKVEKKKVESRGIPQPIGS